MDYPDRTKGPGYSKYCKLTYRNDGYILAKGDETRKASYSAFDVGDVIGRGVDYEANMIFYFKNHEFLDKQKTFPRAISC